MELVFGREDERLLKNQEQIDETIQNNFNEQKMKLSLSNIPVNRLGLVTLMKAQFTNNLKELLLWDNNIGDYGVKMLSMEKWTNLETLRLADNNLTYIGVRWLANGNFQSVSQLSLYKNSIGNEGVRQLIKGKWKNMKNLLLHNCQISYEGLLYLSEGQFPKLTSINLGFNNIEACGAILLSKLNNESLKRFYIFSNKIKKAFVPNLKQAMPGNWNVSI